MWATVVIWYVGYDKIIVNILSGQVLNKNIIISKISVFIFVAVIIIILAISKGVFLFVILPIVLWSSYRLHPCNKGNTCTLSQSCLWIMTSVWCWCCLLTQHLHYFFSWFSKSVVTCISYVYSQLQMKLQCMCISNTDTKRIQSNGKSIW